MYTNFFCKKKKNNNFKRKNLIMKCKPLYSLKTNPRLQCDTNRLLAVWRQQDPQIQQEHKTNSYLAYFVNDKFGQANEYKITSRYQP